MDSPCDDSLITAPQYLYDAHAVEILSVSNIPEVATGLHLQDSVNEDGEYTAPPRVSSTLPTGSTLWQGNVELRRVADTLITDGIEEVNRDKDLISISLPSLKPPPDEQHHATDQSIDQSNR